MSDWDRELDDFEERIRRIERAHRTGAWDDVPTWTPPGSPMDRATAEQAERLHLLLVHASRVGVEVRRAMAERVDEVASSVTRRHAARRYRQSGSLA
jgi:hypothetical protein